jgi:hypothetical protein
VLIVELLEPPVRNTAKKHSKNSEYISCSVFPNTTDLVGKVMVVEVPAHPARRAGPSKPAVASESGMCFFNNDCERSLLI